MKTRCALIGFALLLAARGGQTEQCQNCAAYQTWYWGNPTEAIAFPFSVVDDATTTFWASQFHEGYIGIQTLDDGEKLALFSIWDATEAEPGDPNTWCQPFGGEGVGYSCRSKSFSWQPGVLYTARVERRDGWIRGSLSGGGKTLVLGSIKGDHLPDLGAQTTNFIEQWGFGVTCETAPVASAIFYPPLVDGSAATPASGHVNEKCPRGFVTPHRDGAYVRFGGDDSTLTSSHEEAIAALLRTNRTERLVPYLLAASDERRHGFVRVVNRSALAGTVRIEASDDEAGRSEAMTLSIGADKAVHFNSDDLETGNAGKGLAGSAGDGQGDWRLALRSDLDLEVLAYVRTRDGFLTSMHDVARRTADGHQVPTFNPASNYNQRSLLRVSNLGSEDADLTISGVDDHGRSPGGSVRTEVRAGASLLLSADDLEKGGSGLTGALGDGQGKWRLTVRSAGELSVMSLMASPGGHLTNLSTGAPAALEADGVHTVPLFPSASDALGRQGFVRIVNRSDAAGEVRIVAHDDTGLAYDALTLSLGSGRTAHFNSDDLELGSPAKGLTGSTGAGRGDWRLVLSSELDLEVLAYVRAPSGFLTSMHDVVRSVGRRHDVATFNPGSNWRQESQLRIVNPGAQPAQVSIGGIDDAAQAPGDVVRLTVPAGAAVTLTAPQLEDGGDAFHDGDSTGLGDGRGKWRLQVNSEQALLLVNVLASPTGHLTNLSTSPNR